mgnify:CR=1 FL=1
MDWYITMIYNYKLLCVKFKPNLANITDFLETSQFLQILMMS